MLSHIETTLKDDFEFNFEGLDFPFILHIDQEEGIYLSDLDSSSRFFITTEFLNSDKLILQEEDKECPDLILSLEIKEQIKFLVSQYSY